MSTLDKQLMTGQSSKIFTRVEIAIGRDGLIVTMGVVKTSGLADFDAAALDAFARAQPFGVPPEVRRSFPRTARCTSIGLQW